MFSTKYIAQSLHRSFLNCMQHDRIKLSPLTENAVIYLKHVA
jgi:hypothetical protein